MNRFSNSLKKLKRFTNRICRETSGLALIEFAYSMPFLMIVGLYSTETANMVNAHHKISQAANALADNMSRVGLESSLSQIQLRESDVIDGFVGIMKSTGSLNLTTNGRVILSSLEKNSSGGNTVRWQRCIGLKNSVSSWGVEGTGATGTTFTGMGPAGAQLTAPSSTDAVMVVEIFYNYQPLLPNNMMPTWVFPSSVMHYHAGFIVRDKRDLSGTGIFNPSPAAVQYTCNRFTAT